MTQIESEPRTRQAPNGGRIPPSAIEAEESLIGAMLLSQEAVSIAYETVQAEDFYRPLHGQIFSSIIALANAGEPVDYVTVQAKLQERGAIAVELALLSSLQMNTPSAANAQHYAELVREKAQQRRLISVAGEIVDEAYIATEDVVGLIDEAERKINAIGDAGRTDTVSPLQRLLLSEADILEERGETRGRINGLETGYKSLDQILQGLQPSSMTIVGARPGTGKTAFALGILIHVGAVVKRPALFFSLEMSRQELAERILASTARIDSSKLRTGDLSDADWNRAHEAFGYLQSAKVFIDDNPALTVMDVRARARRIRQQNGDLGVVIIDYLQLMSSRGSRREPSGRGLRDEPIAEDPGARTPVPGHRTLAALAKARRPRGQAPDDVGPSRVRFARARRRRRALHLPPRAVRRSRERQEGRGRDHRRQEPQRPDAHVALDVARRVRAIRERGRGSRDLATRSTKQRRCLIARSLFASTGPRKCDETFSLCSARHSFRATSGPVIRSMSGNVAAIMASDAATPPTTVDQ